MSYAPMYSEQLLEQEPSSTLDSPSIPRKSRNRSRMRPDRPAQRSKSALRFPIVVHSHLCWDWVWQRPQQFVSRLSSKHKILFVELVAPDAALTAPVSTFRQLDAFPNVTVLRLQFPASYWHEGEKIDRERRELVRQFMEGPGAGQFDRPAQWFYDPMAAPAFAGKMDEVLTIYDCMDELSKFACAPPEIVAREQELLARADVVFTGGRRLFESKSRFNKNCHFYGCGVDVEHFGRARSDSLSVPPELQALSKPVLGYFGVVDERMDYSLIAALAEASPEWSIAMVGPVLKVEERTLPRRSNLHWLGKRTYNELPAMCRGFDVCLMPFALNEATEFINPTKALEYMATGRPIVSTGVSDVVRNFGEVVKIAYSPEEFISLSRQAVQTPDRAAVDRGLEMAQANTWDSIVEKLEQHLVHALRLKGKRKD